jgi:hypothetical protein
MKNKLIYTALIIFVLTLSINIISCNDNTDDINYNNVKRQTLNNKTLLGSNIYLPKNTKWFYTNKDHNEVEFELPKGYKFLLFDEKEGTFSLADSGGGYSCTCSESGSCTTFYNKDVGYGCLQSNCTGSCTGKRTKSLSASRIEGVVFIENDKIDTKTDEMASLSDFGKVGIFKIEEFGNEIKKGYDLLYKHIDKPNFNSELSKMNSTKFVFAQTYLYGVELGLVIPKDPKISKFLPNLRLASLEDAGGPKGCSCSGTSGGNCKLEKEGLFGYTVYYCKGCTTCTMN